MCGLENSPDVEIIRLPLLIFDIALGRPPGIREGVLPGDIAAAKPAASERTRGVGINLENGVLLELCSRRAQGAAVGRLGVSDRLTADIRGNEAVFVN